jgi:hypothetical protein
MSGDEVNVTKWMWNEIEGEGVSLATIIMISFRRKNSSDGFWRSICTNDQNDHIQDTRSDHIQGNSQGIFEDVRVTVWV